MNFGGVVLYLWGASHGWLIPEERAAGINTVTAEPIVWALYVYPVWGAFILANLGWFAWNWLRHRHRNLRAYLFVCVVWIVAVIIDYSHHGV